MTLAENLLRSQTISAALNIGFAALFMMVLMFLDRSQTFVYFRF